jgi:hypothetical protein
MKGTLHRGALSGDAPRAKRLSTQAAYRQPLLTKATGATLRRCVEIEDSPGNEVAVRRCRVSLQHKAVAPGLAEAVPGDTKT